MNFSYFADKKYFALVFCGGDTKKLGKFNKFFDFRDPAIKREEYNKKRAIIFKKLLQKYGRRCLLALNSNCTQNKNLVIDHFIPLSSNELNKKLRHLKPIKGKKVPAQSFGSNNLDNLILACAKCNSRKKHKIPTLGMWSKIKHLP